MKKYRYILARDISQYDGWDIVQIIPSETNDYIVIVKEEKPVHNYIKLNEATTEQLLEELYKRLENNNANITD